MYTMWQNIYEYSYVFEYISLAMHVQFINATTGKLHECVTGDEQW